MAEQGIVYHSPREMTWRQEGRWEIPGVSIKGESGTWAIFEKMTSEMNASQIAEYSKSAIEKEEPYVASAPEVWAIASRGYALKNTQTSIDSFRDFMQKSMRRSPSTSSIVSYNPEGIFDQVIYHKGTPLEYVFEGNIVGPDGLIKNIPNKSILNLILGTQDTDKINEVAQWINNTPAYIWRLNQKPSEKQERIARFDANSDRLDFDCDRNPLNEFPAFRVLRIE